MPTADRSQEPRRPIRSSGLRQATESLSNPRFRNVFLGNIAFFLALGGQGVVRPWLAFQLTGDEFDLGLMGAAVALPMLLLSPFGGVLTDRTERRGLMMFAQGIALLSEAGVLALIVSGRIQFWHLVVSSVLVGCCFPLVMPARNAVIVSIVGKRATGAAMSLNMAGYNFTRVVGPATAGFLIPVVGVAGVYGIAIGLYAVAIALTASLGRLPPPPGATDRSVGHDLLAGFQYVGANRLVLVLLALGLVPMVLAMPVQQLLVVFAVDVWKTGGPGTGQLFAAMGVGAVMGSFWMATRPPDAGRLKMMMISVVAFGGFVVLFATSPHFRPALALLVAANIFQSAFSTLNNVAIQLVIPDSHRGRISSFLTMSASLPLLGSLPVAALAKVVGAPLAVSAASALAVVLALVFYASSRELRQLDRRVRRAMRDH